ncbi:MAG: hypothetical protein AAF611_12445 [Bacteroidota bacterium]
MKKKYVVILYNVLVVLAIFGALEYFFEYKLSHPENISGRMKSAAQQYYMKYGRSIVQYEPEMAQYDSSLFYTLKPGTFQFKNQEFEVTFKVNSLGMRDDEASLNTPKIAVLGDSHAMGWGVEQKETFAEVLQKQTGKKVLNTAISSYGTAREFTMLQQVNTDSLQYIIIQYCDNDYEENHAYFHNNNVLDISSKEVYENVSSDQRTKKNYYLFKHVLKFPKLLLSASSDAETVQFPEDEIKVFLNVIQQAKYLHDQVKIVVINVNGRKTTDRFIKKLSEKLRKKRWRHLAKFVIPLDISSGLTEDKYHILDDHLNAKGHLFVANKIEKFINLLEKK